MELFKRLFGYKDKKPLHDEGLTTQNQSVPIKEEEIVNEETERIPDWVDETMSQDEEELVAVIASACLANSLPAKKYHVKKILKVDEDRIVAGLAAISGISQGTENERYRIKSIKRIK